MNKKRIEKEEEKTKQTKKKQLVVDLQIIMIMLPDDTNNSFAKDGLAMTNLL